MSGTSRHRAAPDRQAAPTKPPPAARPKPKPEPFSDAEAANVVVLARRSRKMPPKADRDRLTPEWAEGAMQAAQAGEAGVAAWLTSVEIRDPAAAARCREALAEAGAEPAIIPISRVERESPNRSDLGNAIRLVRMFDGQIRYCHPWGVWLIWDKIRWREDRNGQIYRLAKKMVQAIGAEAAGVEDDSERRQILKWALESESRKRLDAAIYLARTLEGVPVDPDELDRDPWLFNCANGVLDLQTGRLRPHEPHLLLTKLCPVHFDPQADCPRWRTFLNEIMGGDEDLVAYLERVLGYSLTGVVREHQLYFLFGGGRNGKSLLLATIQRMLADYATTINATLLISKRQEDHPTGLTDLDGRRFVSTIEVEDGKQLAEALVKSLTGGDKISARRMHKDFYKFDPVHKLFIAANHKPEVKGQDEAIWARIKMIPFRCTFVDDPDDVAPPYKLLKDKQLDAALAAEAPGILARLARACLDWQAGGLREPAAVREATDSYRAEMDALGDFLAERCIASEGLRVKTAPLYQAYGEWCRLNGHEALTSRKFGAQIDRRGYLLKKSNGDSWRLGIKLREVPGGVTIGKSNTVDDF